MQITLVFTKNYISLHIWERKSNDLAYFYKILVLLQIYVLKSLYIIRLTYSMEYVIITIVRRGKPIDQIMEERT